MESLNLLRYLVIRDKATENQVSDPVNIWDSDDDLINLIN